MCPSQPSSIWDGREHRVLAVLLEPHRPPRVVAARLAALPGPDEVVAVVERLLARPRTHGDPTLLAALRDLGVLADPREDGPHRTQWGIGAFQALRREDPSLTVEDADHAVAAHLAPALARLARLVGGGSVAACDALHAFHPDWWAAEWLDDALWPLLGHGRPGSLARALRVLPTHADLVIRAASRSASSLDAADPAALLASVHDVVMAGHAEPLSRSLARRFVDAIPVLAAMAPHRDGLGEAFELGGCGILHHGSPTTPPTTLLRRLSCLPASWVPRDPAEWRDCRATLRVVGAVIGHMGSTLPRRMAIDSKGRWGEALHRLGGAHDGEGRGFHLGSDLDDVVTAFLDQILRPALILSGHHDGSSRADADLARRLLFGRCTVSTALERSRAWHARHHRIAADLVAISPGFVSVLRWGRGYPDATMPDGEGGDIDMVVLTDGRDLIDEGRRGVCPDGSMGLDHCVAGYADRCATGLSRIVSLRRPTLPGSAFVRLSTADLSPSRAPRDHRLPALAQHRGFRNSDPGTACAYALSGYLAAMAVGDLPIDAHALAPTTVPASPLRMAGYDFRLEGAFAAAMRAWRPILPRGIRDWEPIRFAREGGGPAAPPR